MFGQKKESRKRRKRRKRKKSKRAKKIKRKGAVMRVESDKAEKIDLGKLETDAYVLT